MEAWDVLSAILTQTTKHVRPGVMTLTLNNVAEQYALELGASSYNKGYKPVWAKERYPYATCISVNDEIAHGIPSNRILTNGDLVNIDMGILFQGQCADASLTIPVGQIDERYEKLLYYAQKALYAGVDVIQPGVRVEQIARAIEDTARYGKFVVNRQLTGHGIGKDMHEDPAIYHVTNYLYQTEKDYKKMQDYLDVELTEGQIVCLEPMLTYNDRYGQLSKNGWTFKTKDGMPSAMFEHMVRVTSTGHEILTKHFTFEKINYAN